MSETDCQPGYRWYTCSSPGSEYRGCCSVDACSSGCDPEYRQGNARGSRTVLQTTASRRTRTEFVTSVTTVTPKSPSTLLEGGATLPTEPAQTTTASSLGVASTFSTLTTSPDSVLASSTSTATGAGTFSSGNNKLNTPAIIGGVVGGILACVALFLLGCWIFRYIERKRYTARASWAASTITTNNLPPTLPPSNLSSTNIQSGPFELPASEPLPPPVEMPLEQHPSPRVSIYDPATLSMTVQREGMTYVPRRALAPLAGNAIVRPAARRRADLDAVHPSVIARPASNFAFNIPGNQASAPGGILHGTRERVAQRQRRHLSWQDWAEQGIYDPRANVSDAGEGLSRGEGNHLIQNAGVQGEANARPSIPITRHSY